MATLEERFWKKVQKTKSCWYWTGAKDRAGYGQIRIEGKLKGAHRVAYELLVEEIQAGLHIDHLCRNPPCVNPKHMEPVTRKENTLRGISPYANNAKKESCPEGHPYDRRSGGGRRCSKCDRKTQARMRASYKDQPRKPNPTKQQLQRLIEKGESWVSIGRQHGVSDVAAKKWAKKYELI